MLSKDPREDCQIVYTHQQPPHSGSKQHSPTSHSFTVPSLEDANSGKRHIFLFVRHTCFPSHYHTDSSTTYTKYFFLGQWWRYRSQLSSKKEVGRSKSVLSSSLCSFSFLCSKPFKWPFIVMGHDPSSTDQILSRKSPPPLRITMSGNHSKCLLLMLSIIFLIRPAFRYLDGLPCPDGKNLHVLTYCKWPFNSF